MEKEQKNTKEAFANAWKKTLDFGKKAVDGTKKIVDQTRENIHDQKAKKYVAVSSKEFKSKKFEIPTIIRIEDNFANREFIENDDAIGWIENHKDIPVLHMYESFVKKCGITFIDMPQREHVYCKDYFEFDKYINANQFFGKATKAKSAELHNIAFVLGAKKCSIEVVEKDVQKDSRQLKINVSGAAPVSNAGESSTSNMQSVKNVSEFEGHDNPKQPELKWFAHDENIKNLIKARLDKAIKSTSLELDGASAETMSRSVACALDDILKVSGNASFEKQSVREYNNTIIFNIEF